MNSRLRSWCRLINGMECCMGKNKSNKKSKKFRLTGQMSQYLKWPVYFNVFWVMVMAVMFLINVKAGIFMAFAEILYIIITVSVYFTFKPNITKMLVDFGAEYSQVQRQMLHEMELPYSLLDMDGKVLWTNAEMDSFFQGKNIRNKNVTSLFQDFKPEYLEFDEERRNEFDVTTENGEYRVVLKLFTMGNKEESPLTALAENSGTLICMYMFDETHVRQLTKENREERLMTEL